MTCKVKYIINIFLLFQPGQMFPQSSGWGGAGDQWYGSNIGPNMGPPTSHTRAPPSQLTFDTAYNFHGSAHVMTQPMQEFNVQVSFDPHSPHMIR